MKRSNPLEPRFIDGVRPLRQRREPPAARPVAPPTPPSLGQNSSTPPTPPPARPRPSSAPYDTAPAGLKTRRRRLTRWHWVLGVLIACVIAAIVALGWYTHQLSALSASDSTKVRLVIDRGTTPHQVADKLVDAHLVRSSMAFYIYLVVTNQRDDLQAGTYNLSPSQSTPEIVKELVGGKVSDFSITFYPGGTLTGTTDMEKKYSITRQLEAAGYSDIEIQAAFTADYKQPLLFTGKPVGTSLEGYVYGDTYNFATDTTASAILNRTFDEFAQVVKDNNLVALYKKQHLTLYEGITLASIIQREVDEPKDRTKPSQDQRQVAQVFYTRLKRGMTLGSDVTYIYAAHKLGVTPTPKVDSPYNTRLHKGLPPGPIASPSLSALLAAAHPASTHYLYFISGDDGKTYFAKTASGHQANIATHCHQKCSQ